MMLFPVYFFENIIGLLSQWENITVGIRNFVYFIKSNALQCIFI